MEIKTYTIYMPRIAAALRKKGFPQPDTIKSKYPVEIPFYDNFRSTILRHLFFANAL